MTRSDFVTRVMAAVAIQKKMKHGAASAMGCAQEQGIWRADPAHQTYSENPVVALILYLEKKSVVNEVMIDKALSHINN